MTIQLPAGTGCDYNQDGIIFKDYSDLMKAYNCLLGIKKCNDKYGNWKNMRDEYKYFTGNYN
jgi:hypothetical protein